jgi:hypothetical protein
MKQMLKFTHQAVTLFGSCTTASTEEMAAFTWIRAETSALPTLRAAIDLGKSLTVLRAFTPTTLFAAVVAG